MGLFLSLSGVLGKNQDEVCRALNKYAVQSGGGLRQANLVSDDNNCCVIEEAYNNTSVLYPSAYLEWEQSSEFLSRELNAPVFSFHIHDSDLWMYVLYVNGKIADQFNPIPEYWDDQLSQEEIQSWRGNPDIVAKHAGIERDSISRYLTHWDLDDEANKKAYPDDEFCNEEWQLVDFMKRCCIPYPMDADGKPKGATYELWTKQLHQKPSFNKDLSTNQKHWWEFWK